MIIGLGWGRVGDSEVNLGPGGTLVKREAVAVGKEEWGALCLTSVGVGTLFKYLIIQRPACIAGRAHSYYLMSANWTLESYYLSARRLVNSPRSEFK